MFPHNGPSREVPMKNVARILRFIDRLSEGTGNVVSFLILASMGVVLYEVVMRYVFNLPQTWSSEMSLFLFGTLFALGGAYTLLHRGHVSMDIFYSKWSPKTRAIMDIITFVLFLIFVSVLIWKGWGLAWRAIEFMERSQSGWRPLLWPTKIMVPIGAFLLLLQGLVQLVRNILAVAGKGVSSER
jgi:TRAP-type mannitol/chloroaromatic compound transport system permease small subunit